MKDGDYKKEKFVSAEKTLATLLVLTWMALAYSIGGHGLSVRAFTLFMVPLTMIWLPNILCRIAVRDSRWERDFSPPIGALLIWIVAWFIILGVPVAWMLIFGIANK